MEKFLTRGAEAELFLTEFLSKKCVVKRRVSKKYRIRELDEMLRKTRTKSEANLLHSVKKANILCPIIYGMGEFELLMNFVEGVLLRELMEKKNVSKIIQTLGEELARMHELNIVHGDFTTANVIVNKSKPCIIDFGLGGFSQDVEEKATDVLLMKKSLGDEKLFQSFLTGYSKNREYSKVMKQVTEIEKRGRYVVRSWARA
jgi:N6-L-threonylcarbamoyladenine synthase/protein kinase Bud32